MKQPFAILFVILFTIQCPIWGQETAKSIVIGNHLDALNISESSDTVIAGVYLMVDEGYEHDIDLLAQPVLSYFNHFEVPAIIVKQQSPFEGQGARMRVYIDGKISGGDLSTGDISLFELQQNPTKVFTLIMAQYVIAELEALEEELQTSINNRKK